MTVDLSDLFDPAAVSAETAAFNARLEAELAQLPNMTLFPPGIVRASRAEGKGVIPLGGPLEGSEWVAIPGAPGGPGRVRISEPGGDPVGIYLHIHGGGWTIGGAEQSDASCQAMAKATGMRVVSVSYRLAPEHPWPAQKMDCMAAARWVLEQSDLPVVIGGESAGAHLSAVTAIGLRDEGLGERIRGLVLYYGCFDLRGTPSAMNWGERNMILSTPIIEWFFDFVDPDRQARHRPDISPVMADLRGLPPALFMVGTEDPLMDDSLFMAARWRAAGNSGRLKVYPGGVHAFDAFDELEIARDSRSQAAAFAKACVAT